MPRKLTHEEASELMKVNGFTPIEEYRNSVSPWLSIRESCGHQVSPTLSNVKFGKGGCPICSKTFVNPDEAKNDMRSVGVEPLEEYPGANKRWRCLCTKCGREVFPRRASVQSGQSACGYCAGRAVHPEEAAQFMIESNLIPLENFPGAKVKWKCECEFCKSVVFPVYGNIKAGWGGCRKCGGKKGRTTRITNEEERVLEVMANALLKPLEPYNGNKHKWRIRCLRCNQETTTRFNDVQQGHSGCMNCGSKAGGLKIALDPEVAVQTMVNASLQPLEPYPGASSKWKCKCLICGNVVTPVYGSIQQGNGGCIYCAPYGMDMGVASCLYLLSSTEYDACKVGISNVESLKKRLAEHKKQSFVELHKKWDFKTGFDAYTVEQGVISWWRDELGIPPALTRREMPRHGYSETASVTLISIKFTVAKIEELITARKSP
jgi:hypothetical protein